jgi:SAM-dependent methyltransferase
MSTYTNGESPCKKAKTEHSSEKVEHSSDYGFKQAEWKFDGNVAGNWNNELNGHIPAYRGVISMIAEITLRLFGTDARVLSMWCSNGNQFAEYVRRGWSTEKLFGMNYSLPLNELCKERFPNIHVFIGDESLRQKNPPQIGFDPMDATALGGKFDTIQWVWAMHFEPIETREYGIQRCFDALKPGGLFCLAEKTRQPLVLEGLYHDFKRAQGVEEHVIQAKKKAIKGVLDTQTSIWYESALQKAGFVDIAVIHAQVGFVTWMARKPAPGLVVGQMLSGGEKTDISVDPQVPSGLRTDVSNLFVMPTSTSTWVSAKALNFSQ